jgi:thiol-disulfide isomerase/thioredoxin
MPAPRLPHLLCLCALLVCALTATACLDAGTAADDASSSTTDATAREGYPAGPYGAAVNATITNHDTFLTTAGEPWALSSVYQDSSKRLLFISTAAGWCTACIKEQPKIQALQDTYGSRGLAVVVSLFEDAQFKPADAALAADWRSRYGLSVNVVADPSFALQAYYDPTLTPMNMIIDVNTMQILWLTTGWDQSTIDAILSSKL